MDERNPKRLSGHLLCGTSGRHPGLLTQRRDTPGTCQGNTHRSTRHQTNAESIQMRIPHKRNRIPRIRHITTKTKNGRRENPDHPGLKGTNERQRGTEFPGLRQFLPMVHQRLQQDYDASVLPDKERKSMEMGGQVAGGV